MMKIIPHRAIGNIDFPYRTEDIRFSPSGRRLAIIATDGCILLYAVDLSLRPILVTYQTEIRSPALLVPHGIEFLDEETLVVANRNGGLSFFRVPATEKLPAVCNMEALLQASSSLFGNTGVTRQLRGRPLFCGPGSIRSLNGILYVTCNYKNTISTFAWRIEQGRIVLEEGCVLAHEGLEVIDGVAISKDGGLMALSDHDHHRIVVYRRTSPAHATHWPNYELSCSLRDPDMHYPHGLRFDNSEQALYVADAGGRFLHVFVDRDGWRGNADCSFYKTMGVDQEAFNKSKQATAAEHQALEGGAKGLDIAPDGNVMAATCRNQLIRFFDISANNAVPAGVSSTASFAFRHDIALSCVVDDTPGIWRSLIPWLATATALSGIAPTNIHLHHVCALPSAVSELCAQLGVATHPIQAFSKENPYTNKIGQCATDFGPVNSVVLTDVDMVFAGPPPFHELRDLVAGKPVDFPNPPLSVLRKIFTAAGVDVLGVVSNTYGHEEQYPSFETLIGNFNGGLYCIPNDKLPSLAKRWAAWAHWMFDNAILLESWHVHSDQVAFCLALSELNLPVRVLGHHWNFPTHLQQLPLYTPPWILHHHARFDVEGLLMPMSDPIAQNRVTQINATIRAFKQRHPRAAEAAAARQS